ncbi:MAG: transcriptional repressor [Bacteroidales bacterium]|nr:transcriptional repressor [Bacteroidales bacterium]MBR2226501.1 transcriptional repressor [Bacteroidales bacterium]MBR3097701.1 transcriptional repressor [Bacteroidales bacterium]
MASATNNTMPTLDEFRTRLKRHGLKATRQRLEVHEAMMVLGHASADMVTEEIGRRGVVKVTVASVYNILSQLADLRIYNRRLSSNNKMYFDINNFRHIHLYDRENHRFRDIFDDELAELVQAHLKRRRFRGFTVEDIDIQLIARPTRKSKTV